jgi:tRNA-modifying protein YgfZ
MEKTQQNASPDYWSTLEGAGFFLQSEVGCLRFSDQGRLEFLQRQTTNDMSGLRIGKAVTTLLISPTARILDVLKLIDEGEHILALTLPGHGSNTLLYLTYRIFFMDKVQISDVTQQFIQIDLEGPDASDVLKKLGIDTVPGVDEVTEIEFQGNPLWVIRQSGFSEHGFRLFAPAICQIGLKESLLAGEAVELTSESYNTLRVENGIPAAGAELTEEYTPLEVGMKWAVSGGKGCYPGQEVIARQITYDKVTQKLVGLRFDTRLSKGTHLFIEGKLVGSITSTANSPRFGLIALGVVKRPYNETGTILESSRGEQADPVPVVVVELPFQE